MQKIQQIEQLLTSYHQKYSDGVTTKVIAESLNLDRSTASRYLNQLVQQNRAKKIVGRPVRYFPIEGEKKDNLSHYFPNLIGIDGSLKQIAKEALAACMYPSKGLPILLTGETGVGKSYFAKALDHAIRSFRPSTSSPFISFNCAEYAHNPELLMAQLFGVKKGAFTGASQDKMGLVERADQGILFLDEIHRLPPAGQEMLFHLMDQGIYRRLGESDVERKAEFVLIGATTEEPEQSLLPTLYRRFSVKLTIPPMRERPREEREQYLRYFLAKEEKKIGRSISLSAQAHTLFLDYECPGNLGQLKSDIQLACAHAYLRQYHVKDDKIKIERDDLPTSLRTKITIQRPRLIAIVHEKEEALASSIHDYLHERLSENDPDIKIQVIGLKRKEDITSSLKQLEQDHHLIAVISTFLFESDHLFCLSAMELHQPYGFKQLKERIAATRTLSNELNEENIFSPIYQGMAETVTHFNPRRFVSLLKQHAASFRDVFQWEPDKEIGIWMHLGIYTDQLLKKQRLDSPKPTRSPSNHQTIYPADIQLWEQLLYQLEETFHVIYPPSTATDLARLSR